LYPLGVQEAPLLVDRLHRLGRGAVAGSGPERQDGVDLRQVGCRRSDRRGDKMDKIDLEQANWKEETLIPYNWLVLIGDPLLSRKRVPSTAVTGQ
jgi:hypothetical protein